MRKGVLYCDSFESYQRMAKLLSGSLNYYLLPYTTDESSVLELARNNRVDVIVSSMSLPGIDGIDLINEVRDHSYKNVKAILIASCECEGIIRSVVKYKIDNLLIQPVSAESILRRIDDLYDEVDIPQKRISREKRINEVLKTLGVPANLQGYSYLRTAIEMSIDDEENLIKITKMLYPNVATLHKTTTSRVERSIRHAIEIAYMRGSSDVFDDYFGYTIDVNKAKPTNSEFIAMVSNRLKLEL